MSSTLAQAEEYIPANVRMISGCQDSQTSADVSNVATFQLPDPAGRAGGACTAAMLKTLYHDEDNPAMDLSFQDTLLQMRDVLSEGKYTQIPQLSSSRPLDIHTKFDLVPDSGFSGTKRSVLIGINYVGQDGELAGCHNDVGNMTRYIQKVHGFTETHMTVLMDDGSHQAPTYDNIMSAFRQLVSDTQEGDAVFVHYSGHGGKLADQDGDEADGYDETLVPVDFQGAGQIRDDDIFKVLIGPMPRNVTMTCVMDCCHSGTVLDLPYTFVADGTQEEMMETPGFDFGTLMKLYQSFQTFKQGGGGLDSIPPEAIAAAQKIAGECCVIS